MRTLGIDLSSDPTRTGAAVVEWSSRHGTLVECTREAGDPALAQLAKGCDVIAIDAPFGWPRPFVDAVDAYRRGHPFPTGPERDDLRFRTTDLVTREAGSPPLSVSTDLIGIVAFRAVKLLPKLGKGGAPARDGTDGIIEVYPAAALKRWGAPFRLYKRAEEGHREARKTMLDMLRTRWIDVGGYEQWLLNSADALDALICAVIAFEYHEKRTDPIPDELRDFAREEGWIHLPRPVPNASDGSMDANL